MTRRHELRDGQSKCSSPLPSSTAATTTTRIPRPMIDKSRACWVTPWSTLSSTLISTPNAPPRASPSSPGAHSESSPRGSRSWGSTTAPSLPERTWPRACAWDDPSHGTDPGNVRARRKAEPAGKQRCVVLDVADVVDLVVQLGQPLPREAALPGVEVKPVHRGVDHLVAHLPVLEHRIARIEAWQSNDRYAHYVGRGAKGGANSTLSPSCSPEMIWARLMLVRPTRTGTGRPSAPPGR